MLGITNNMSKPNYHIMKLTDEQKKTLTMLTNDVIDLIEARTYSLDEQAFVLRILFESFEEAQNCVVPFNKRYTEPVWNYQKKGAEE